VYYLAFYVVGLTGFITYLNCKPTRKARGGGGQQSSRETLPVPRGIIATSGAGVCQSETRLKLSLVGLTQGCPRRGVPRGLLHPTTKA
jgi:hypothetical protein